MPLSMVDIHILNETLMYFIVRVYYTLELGFSSYAYKYGVWRKHCIQPYIENNINLTLSLVSLFLCSCSSILFLLFILFTTRYQHEFAQIILVEDEVSQD